MIVFLFSLLIIIYGIFIYKNSYNFISFYWLIAYAFAFLLPISLNIFDRFGYLIPPTAYKTLNVYYLIVLILFILTNYLSLYFAKKEKKIPKYKIRYLHAKKMIIIYILLTLGIILFLGTEVLISGTGALLHINPLVSMLLPSTIYGSIFISGLMFILADTKKQKRLSLIIMIFMILFGLTFTFGRRIVIYPLLSVIILYYLKNRKKPNLIIILMTLILAIFIVLPLMISVRTFGLINAFPKLIDLYFNNQHLLREYIAMSTDVSAEYSLAALLVAANISTNPLTLLKPVLIFIPRSVWPNKPVALSEQLVVDLGLSKVDAMSIPPGIVGESYTYFGFLGIILLGIFWGWLTAYFDKNILLFRDENSHYLDIFSIFVVCFSIQFITGAIRGDTSTTIQESLYLFSPLVILLFLSKYKIKR